MATNSPTIAPATAEKFDLATEDIVRLESDGQSITGPVLIQPGHAENCVTCHLGYGRTRSGKTGTGLGFNAYVFRADEGGYIALTLP